MGWKEGMELCWEWNCSVKWFIGMKLSGMSDKNKEIIPINPANHSFVSIQHISHIDEVSSCMGSLIHTSILITLFPDSSTLFGIGTMSYITLCERNMCSRIIEKNGP